MAFAEHWGFDNTNISITQITPELAETPDKIITLGRMTHQTI